MMKFNKTKLSMAIALLLSSYAFADNATVVVTAKPDIAEIEIDKFSSTSAVVTDDTIRDLHAADLASALRNTPGTQISRYNPIGSFGGDQGGAIFIRGMGLSRPGSEIKTYIDNVPMYMPIWNHALLDLLPVNGMRDITIYKSPQPQINGNNFASINLNSKTATKAGISGNARVSYGSFNTVIEQADLVGRVNDVDFSFAQGFSSSNGHRANASGQLANVMGSLGLKINQNWSVGISGMAINNTAKDPGNNTQPPLPIAASYDSAAQMATAYLKHSYDAVEGELRVYTNTGKGNLNNDVQTNGWGTSQNSFQMNGIRWKESINPWKGGNVVVGLDYDQSSGSVTTTPIAWGTQTLSTTTTKTKMPTFIMTSPYIGFNQMISLSDKWSLIPSVGLRNYQSNQYASKNAPYGGISLVSDSVTLFANASKGINYPGLEGPALAAGTGLNLGQSWKNLSAEEMNHLEVGGKFLPDNKSRIDISLFQDAITNRYVSSLNWMGGNGYWYNSGGYTIRGTELSAQREILPNLTLFGGWTYLSNNSTANLPYVPKNAFNLAATGYVGKFRISIDGQYQSDFFALNSNRDGTLNTQKIDGFPVANARVSYPIPQLGKKGEVFVMVENLFNQKYSYRQGYPMPGTWGSVGLSASFE
jgi:outer membrane cobalamin receptor